MKITVEFDNEAEYEAFKTSGKRTRAKKGEGDDGAAENQPPAPMNPPQAAVLGGPVFGGAVVGGFPGASVGPSPEVMGIVTRITTAVDNAIRSGQPEATVLGWFQAECVKAGKTEAQAASLDTIKNTILPGMSIPALANIAKLMNA